MLRINILGQQQGNPKPVQQNTANLPQLPNERVPMNSVRVNVRDLSVGRNGRERRGVEEEYRDRQPPSHVHQEMNQETSVDSTFTKAIVQVPYANQANVINLRQTKSGGNIMKIDQVYECYQNKKIPKDEFHINC